MVVTQFKSSLIKQTTVFTKKKKKITLKERDSHGPEISVWLKHVIKFTSTGHLVIEKHLQHLMDSTVLPPNSQNEPGKASFQRCDPTNPRTDGHL